MNQALYRKYRSKSFEELVGQPHVAAALKQAVEAGRVSHAYLLTGPRGVGKTSVARIIAHRVNDLVYDENLTHLDIIEIDAASNRRIDEIRDLRDKVHIAPSQARYKVYIIDEVHMLTKEAFNALLKTLEEPPAHAIFILATTELHKVPATIVSRTQRFHFQPIPPATIAAHLAKIAKNEKINASDEALQLIAEHARGSFRDAISLLDQLSSYKKIDKKTVVDLLGLPPEEVVTGLAGAVQKGDNQAVLSHLDELRAAGHSPTVVAHAVAARLRQALLSGNHPEKARLKSVLRELLEVDTSPSPADSLELALITIEPPNVPNEPPPTTAPKASRAAAAVTVARPASVKNFSGGDWSRLLKNVKQRAPSLYTALRLADYRFENGVLRLDFEFPLHHKKMTAAANQQIVARAMTEIGVESKGISSRVTKRSRRQGAVSPDANRPGQNAPADDLAVISNIFGAAELLES